jgi:glycyl-tRNA synthetase
MLDKTERLEVLAPYLGSSLGLSEDELDIVKQAAYLAKADLATKMVVEMTSLQGVMGREYARLSGEDPEVADAIFEHYLPRSAGDRIPRSKVGVALALADRVDSLVGLFSVGMAPTGSADPFGLRRAAAGIVQILIDKEIDLSLRPAITKALESLPVEAEADVDEAVLSFVAGRLEVALREMGLAYDVVAAALGARADNPLLALQSARQVSRWVAREDWPVLLDNYARCVRITRDQPSYTLVADNLVEAEEKALYGALLDAEKKISPDSDVDAMMAVFVPLVPHIQQFFDEVLVMAEDEALRQARLALLQRVAALADGIVDLRRLEGF